MTILPLNLDYEQLLNQLYSKVEILILKSRLSTTRQVSAHPNQNSNVETKRNSDANRIKILRSISKFDAGPNVCNDLTLASAFT